MSSGIHAQVDSEPLSVQEPSQASLPPPSNTFGAMIEERPGDAFWHSVALVGAQALNTVSLLMELTLHDPFRLPRRFEHIISRATPRGADSIWRRYSR